MTAKPSAGLDLRRPLASFVAATRGVLLEPSRFFADLREERSYAGPVIYALLCQFLAVLLAGAYDFARAAATGTLGAISVVGTDGAAGALLWVLLLLGLAPLYALATLAVGTVAYQGLVLVFVGRGNAGIGATFRVTAYLSAVSLLIWLPILGLLAGLYGVWINAAGLKQFHQTTTTRAVLVAAIPYIVFLAWSVYGVATGSTTLAEFLIGGGTNFPTTDEPLAPGI